MMMSTLILSSYCFLRLFEVEPSACEPGHVCLGKREDWGC